MAFTVDYTTDRGQVRLLITDVDADNPLFDDDQVDAFLALESGVKRAAAAALDTIASNEALVQKKTRMMDIQTDGPAVAAALRTHAERLRGQAEDDEVDGAFDWAEMVTNDFSARERVYAEALREGV